MCEFVGLWRSLAVCLSVSLWSFVNTRSIDLFAFAATCRAYGAVSSAPRYKLFFRNWTRSSVSGVQRRVQVAGSRKRFRGSDWSPEGKNDAFPPRTFPGQGAFCTNSNTGLRGNSHWVQLTFVFRNSWVPNPESWSSSVYPCPGCFALCYCQSCSRWQRVKYFLRKLTCNMQLFPGTTSCNCWSMCFKTQFSQQERISSV